MSLWPIHYSWWIGSDSIRELSIPTRYIPRNYPASLAAVRTTFVVVAAIREAFAAVRATFAASRANIAATRATVTTTRATFVAILAAFAAGKLVCSATYPIFVLARPTFAVARSTFTAVKSVFTATRSTFTVASFICVSTRLAFASPRSTPAVAGSISFCPGSTGSTTL